MLWSGLATASFVLSALNPAVPAFALGNRRTVWPAVSYSSSVVRSAPGSSGGTYDAIHAPSQLIVVRRPSGRGMWASSVPVAALHSWTASSVAVASRAPATNHAFMTWPVADTPSSASGSAVANTRASRLVAATSRPPEASN